MMRAKTSYFKRLAYFVSLIVLCTCNLLPTVNAISDEQKKLFNKGIYYFDLSSCQAVDSASSGTTGGGPADGAAYPNLPAAPMADAINQFIAQENPNSEMKDLGETIVKSAQAAGVSPFLIVSIAHKESGLANPSDFNVSHGSNSFGRMAGAGQPSFHGARDWYKWSSVKASVDSDAEENKNVKGGGDIAAYIAKQYADKIKNGTITDLMNEYAPPNDGNDTTQYIKDIKTWTEELIRLTTNSSGTTGKTVSEGTDPGTSTATSCACTSPGSGGAFSGSVSPQVGNGLSDKGKESLQKAVVAAGEKYKVDPNFIASFYYAENSRTGDKTNNADSASGTPATGDGKWREPPSPYGSGSAWPAPNGFSAAGPFQFITSTWQSYKPDGANDTSDRNDLMKEAEAAGKYLAASGAKDKKDDESLKKAAFAYNHSNTYVESVLNTYKYLGSHGSSDVSGDAASGTDEACSDTGATGSGEIPTGDAKALAAKLLELKDSGKYRCDNPADCTDLKNVSEGKPIGGECGVDTFDPKILKLIIYMINNGFKVGTFALCGDHHDDGPNGHHGGKAVDISSINGVSVNSAGGKEETMKAAKFIGKIDGELAVRQLITDGYGEQHDQDLTDLTILKSGGQTFKGSTAAGYYGASTMAQHRNHIHAGY